MDLNRRGALTALLCAAAACSKSTDALPLGPLSWPSSATIPLTYEYDDGYAAQIAIGGESFLLLVDTGSATLAVASAGCDSCAGLSPLYAPGPGAVDTGEQTSGNYSDEAEWSAEIYEDHVSLGDGTPAVPMKLAAVVGELGFFRNDEVDGILGIGPPQSLVGDTSAFMTNAVDTGAVAKLSFELCADGGTMWLGDFDASKASAAPQYTPLVPATSDSPYYLLAITDLGVGVTSLGFGASTYVEPVFDTGTAELFLPTPAYQALLAAVNQSAGVGALFPGQQLSDSARCLTNASVTAAQVDAALPPMWTQFPDGNGGSFKISAAPTRSYLTPPDTEGAFCLAVIDGGAPGPLTTVLGDSYLGAFISVLDLANQRIGFAPDIGCRNP